MKDERESHESTWFSKDSMTGNGEVLKAHSAMASITSCKMMQKKERKVSVSRAKVITEQLKGNLKYIKKKKTRRMTAFKH